jgi:hypothetical protein
MVRHESPAHIVNEATLVDQRVLSTPSYPAVEIDRTVRDDGTEVFSVQSRMVIEKDAITALLTIPLDIQTDNWRDVLSGLRDLSYPGRRVRRLAKAASLGSYLDMIRMPSRELADVINMNKDFDTYTVNVPTFNYGQAHRYTLESILPSVDHDSLLLLLQGATSQRIAGELGAVSAFYDDIERSERNGKAIDYVQKFHSGAFNEVIEQITASQFRKFSRTAQVTRVDDTVHADDGTADTYMLARHVPKSILHDTHDVRRQAEIDATVHVHVGPVLRDRDKKTGLERHAVTFHTQTMRVSALPRLVWTKQAASDDSVRRQIILPTSQRLRYVEGETVVRKQPSSIAGAALALCVLGQDIDYSKQLGRVFGHFDTTKDMRDVLPRAAAGMLPLVMGYQQQDMMHANAAYFEAMERGYNE